MLDEVINVVDILCTDFGKMIISINNKVEQKVGE